MTSLSSSQSLARQLGAKCDECPLKSQEPCIPPQVKAPVHRKLAVVAETPAKVECQKGQYLVGPTGEFWEERILQPIGVPRSELHVTNALMCWPQRAMDPKEWKAAVSACRPRLQNELSAVAPVAVLTYGKRSLSSILETSDLGGMAGAPVWPTPERPYTVLPTWHPAMLFKADDQRGDDKYAYIPVLRVHTLRAWEVAHNRVPKWKWPKISLNNAEDLEAVLSARVITCDIETYRKSGLYRRTRCFGFTSAKGTAVVRNRSEFVEIIRKVAADPKKTWVFQNGIFDRTNFALKEGIHFVGRVEDTMTARSIITPELPVGLAFQICVEYAAPRWKDAHWNKNEKDVETEDQLKETQIYCGQDNIVTLKVRDRNNERLAERPRALEVYENRLKLNELAVRMAIRGIKVDPLRRAFHSRTLKRRTLRARRQLRELATLAGFRTPDDKPLNPWSKKHLWAFFFEYLGVAVTQRSKTTGEPKLDESVLAELKVAANPVVAKAAALVLRCRRWRHMNAGQVLGLELDDKNVVHAMGRPAGAKKTGRWSYSNPNLNGVPKAVEESRRKILKNKGKTYVVHGGLRDMYVAHNPDHWVVEADFSQIELRLAALLANDKPYLEAFARGDDPHDLNARVLFNILAPNVKVTEQQRTLAKNFVYLIIYGGDADKLYHTISPLDPRFTKRDARVAIDLMLQQHGAIPIWQDKNYAFALDNKFIEAPLSGHRRYFWGSIEKPKVLNFPVQTDAAEVFNQAALRVSAKLDWPNEGIMLANHDALIVDGPDPIRIASILKTQMETPVILGGAATVFPVEVKIGKAWGRLKKVKDLSRIEEVMEAVLKAEFSRRAV
jgi:uracil-DNA glycosylase family 4